MNKLLLLILMGLPFYAQAQFLMLIGVSPAECKAYYIDQGMQVYFDNEFPDEPASLVAESRDYTITTMFDHEQAIHASALSKSELSFNNIYEQYESWVQVGKHKRPSADDHSIVLSAFETTSEFPKLFIGLYDEVHQTETNRALKLLQCDWEIVLNYLAAPINADEEADFDGQAFISPEIKPYYKECEHAEEGKEDCTNLKMIKYISTNIHYPEIAREKEISGTVFIQFIVNKTGKVLKPKLMRGVSPSLDSEAMRLVSSLPQMEPGTQQGKPIAVLYTIPVKFRLQ